MISSFNGRHYAEVEEASKDSKADEAEVGLKKSTKGEGLASDCIRYLPSTVSSMKVVPEWGGGVLW